MEILIPTLLRIKPKAIFKLGKYLRSENLNTCVFLYGKGIKDLVGRDIEISLSSSEIKVTEEYVIETNDIEKIFELSIKIPKKTDAIVAIGGGMAIDFAKYLSFILHLPLVSVPTAISNDGFASPLSSLNINGKRKSIKSAMPFGVIIDTDIIRNAPEKFIYSGIGDLVCKYTAIHDWKLALKNKNEIIIDFAKTISQNSIDTFYYYEPKDIKSLEFLRILASSMLMSGIAMEIAGSSRPASGSEHLISHAYDRFKTKPSIHGLQVGVATYCVSFIQNENHDKVKKVLTECGFFDFMKKNKLSKSDFIESVKLANTIKEDFYTVLSEESKITELLDFISRDEILSNILE